MITDETMKWANTTPTEAGLYVFISEELQGLSSDPLRWAEMVRVEHVTPLGLSIVRSRLGYCASRVSVGDLRGEWLQIKRNVGPVTPSPAGSWRKAKGVLGELDGADTA